ncbi:MAG TPA: DUF2911 domain-containing protein [Cyclobacteriaceae bacterium]|nr:DUF2911 domain-containing protein [Cyclobacteriaceae bacterium]
MKKLLTIALLAACFVAEAQIQIPSASPAGSVSSVIGITDVKIDYFRPRVKGRKVFGEKDVMHPYGQIWRTGANNGTKISFSTDVSVEGVEVPKGEYLIFTWPGATEWTVSLYKDISIGGATESYDKTKEAANFKVKAEKPATLVETLTLSIDDISSDNKSGVVSLAWENAKINFTVSADYDASVMKSIEEKTKVSPGNYVTAANYYFNNNKDLKKALEWITIGIETGNKEAFWNIHTKAQIQKKLGDNAGALATAQESLTKAKAAEDDFGYVKRNEDLIKEINTELAKAPATKKKK